MERVTQALPLLKYLSSAPDSEIKIHLSDPVVKLFGEITYNLLNRGYFELTAEEKKYFSRFSGKIALISRKRLPKLQRKALLLSSPKLVRAIAKLTVSCFEGTETDPESEN